jgi:hypothetical protein
MFSTFEVVRKTDVVDIKKERRRHDIETRYQELMINWQDHFSYSMRMLRADFKMKVHIAKSLRDAQLRELEGRDVDD